MVLRVILLVLVVVVGRALYYLYYNWRGNRYYQIYQTYLMKQDNESATRLLEIGVQVERLFRIAGLHKIRIPYVDAVGYGQLATGNIAPAENLDNLREDVVGTNIRLFERAIGTCKMRCIESFNPIFWVESVVYLPGKVLAFLGMKADNFFVKASQLLWWMFAAAATIIGVVFNHDFITWLKGIL